MKLEPRKGFQKIDTGNVFEERNIISSQKHKNNLYIFTEKGIYQLELPTFWQKLKKWILRK